MTSAIGRRLSLVLLGVLSLKHAVCASKSSVNSASLNHSATSASHVASNGACSCENAGKLAANPSEKSTIMDVSLTWSSCAFPAHPPFERASFDSAHHRHGAKSALSQASRPAEIKQEVGVRYVDHLLLFVPIN